MEMLKLFQIGDIAKLFHLSVSSLRHYEKIGLVKPERIDPETGYRYYSVRQFNALNTIRYLRVLDMPLEEIAEFLQNRDVDKIEEKLLRQKEAVIRKQQELRLIERKIDHRLRQFHDALHSELETIRIQAFPPQRLVIQQNTLNIKSFFDMESPLCPLAEAQSEPVIFIGKVGLGISMEHLETEQLDSYDYVFLLLDEEDTYAGSVDELPAENCAVIRFCGYHDDSPSYYRRLLDFIRQEKLEISGFSREITMIDYGVTNPYSGQRHSRASSAGVLK